MNRVFRSLSLFEGKIIDSYPYLQQSSSKSSDYAKKRGAPKLLRHIAFYDAEKKRTFEFLSNNFHLTASTIAAIYKDRWKVKLFLKPSNKT